MDNGSPKKRREMGALCLWTQWPCHCQLSRELHNQTSQRKLSWEK